MKKSILATLLVLFGYCAVYFLGQPLALHSDSVSRIWATAFHPLRLIQYRSLYAGERHEQGTLQRNGSGGWSLRFLLPQGDPHDGLTHGVSLRVPVHLSAEVATAAGQPVAVRIGKEPDPQHFNCARYVLTSVTPLR